MRDYPTRAQMIETARDHISSDGDRFSLTRLSKVLGCSPSSIRRHFPTKEDLMTAVSGARPADTITGADQKQDAPVSFEHDWVESENDWVDRRFRVFERAIATLEGEVENVRQDQIKSVSQLEEKFEAAVEAVKAATVQTQSSEFAAPHPGNGEAIAVAPPLLDDVMPEMGPPPRIDPSMDEAPPAFMEDGALEFEPPPRIDLDADLEELAGAKPETDLKKIRSDLVFTASQLDTTGEEKSRKDMVILGVTAFAVALGIASLVVGFTSRAGATFVPGSKPPVHGAPLASAKATAAKHVALPAKMTALIIIDATGLDKIPDASTVLKQAGAGDAKAQAKLALNFLRGDGISADPMMAAFWSEAGAQQGNPEAEYLLSALYSEGIKPDPTLAFRWLTKAANHHNPKAMHNMAVALLTGTGVAEDKAAAVQWLEKAANLGYRDSAFDLGVIYERGDGVVQNRSTALSWYDAAAALGDKEAADRAQTLRENGFTYTKHS